VLVTQQQELAAATAVLEEVEEVEKAVAIVIIAKY
jgi:hypothetical protein